MLPVRSLRFNRLLAIFADMLLVFLQRTRLHVLPFAARTFTRFRPYTGVVSLDIGTISVGLSKITSFQIYV